MISHLKIYISQNETSNPFICVVLSLYIESFVMAPRLGCLTHQVGCHMMLTPALSRTGTKVDMAQNLLLTD